MRLRISCVVIAVVLALCAVSLAQTRGKARPKKGKICGDPTATCKTEATFDPQDLPFVIPKNAVIWESESFYAIVLRSVKQDMDCKQFIPENERLEAQALFPKNKVFTSRCDMGGMLYYTGVDSNYYFMAVYGGATKAQAEKMLQTVKATGKFPGANVRRMSAGFNGT
ncbi:MAG: hypothetical protein JOZ52_05655 [Acidobacteria bacterium]|nr:hypothetical protein [Acidobacteriota bacterium]